MKKIIQINNKKGEINMAIKEKDIRDIIGDWKIGEKFIMTKSWNTEDGEYVGKIFTLLCKRSDVAVFSLDNSLYNFIQVPYSIAVQMFEKIEEKEHNSEYFTDNTFFNVALSRADVVVQTIFHKTTIVAVRFANGFVIVESSSCVHENDYNKELGIKLCMQKIEQKYMEHIAFEFCDDVYGWSSVEQRCEWD